MKIFGGIKKIYKILDAKAKKKYYFLFFLLIIKSLLDGFGLGLIGPFIAAVGKPSLIFNNGIFQIINLRIGITTNEQLVVLMSVLLIIWFIIKNLFTLSVTYYQSKLIFSDRAAQSKRLFHSYMCAPYSYHLMNNTAISDRNIRFEIPNLYAFIESILVIFSNLFLVLIIFVILTITNLTAVIFIGLFIVLSSVLILFISGKYSNTLGLALQRSQLHLGQALKEGLSTIIETKLGRIESFFPERYFRHYMVTSRSQWRQTTLNSIPTLFFEIVAIVILSGTMISLSLNGINILDVLPIIGVFCYAFLRLLPAVNSIIRHLNNIEFVTPAVNVIYTEFQKFDLGGNPPKRNSSNSDVIGFQCLNIDNVSFGFQGQTNKMVLENVSFVINKGDIVGITGPSGSGKTTLLNIILGLVEPGSGLVYLNGQPILGNLSAWRSIIGYVPQNITLIDASIRENVALGVPSNMINNDKVIAVLNEAYLAEYLESLSDGLDTMIGENGIRLSGGQRQRLGLARALYGDPQILVFDEATSALDVEVEKKITEEIMKFGGERTLILVSHRISSIKQCDVIFYLKSGRIVDSGKFSKLAEINQDFASIID